MTGSTRALGCLCLFLALAVTRAGAQERWSFEARIGVAAPTQSLQDDLGPGFGLDGTLGYRLVPALAAYAGWGWMHFGVAESFAGSNVDYEETALTVGLRFEHPLSQESGLAYWLRAGALYGHVELEDSDGDRFADSGHGVGWELGAGVGLDVRGARLTPGLRFRALSRDVAVEGVTTDVDLRYLAAEVGVRFAL